MSITNIYPKTSCGIHILRFAGLFESLYPPLRLHLRDIPMCFAQGIIPFALPIVSECQYHGYPIALRHTDKDGIMNVIFCHQNVAQINLYDP
jgi:hypothetical protein